MKFIDLFAGLGGFHLALEELGHKCVFASELNSDLRSIYIENFKGMSEKNVVGDIHAVDVDQIPKHDILCAGFPCQPFSQAGFRKGLNDPYNGNHFYKIIEILKKHKPEYLILENVSNLMGHDSGNTWKVIQELLRGKGLKYEITAKIMSPHEFGIPHHRKRIYIVGRKKSLGDFNFDFHQKQSVNNSSIYDIIKSSPYKKEDLTLKEISTEHINVWQEFLNNIKDPKLVPRFPVWAAEFGATYPFKEKATVKYNLSDLIGKKGEFGKEIKGNSKNEILKYLPKYARTDQSVFPDWKKNYIRSNREFYKKNKSWIKEWVKKISTYEHSHQKFEWNCGIVPLEIKGKIIQFRPSGIRVKNPNYSPALVLASTQIPVIWDYDLNKYRYLSIKEAAKLQCMQKLKEFPTPIARAYRALGNAVNVKVVKEIAKRLINE